MHTSKSKQVQNVSLFLILIMIIYTIWATYYHHATKDRPHNIPIVSALKDFVDLPDVSHDGVQSNPIPVIAGSQHHHHHHHHKQTLSKGQLSQHQQQQQKPILLPYPPPPKIPIRKANAAFVMLVREQDLQGARQAVREIEDRFNRNFEYPYVFLNEISFSNNFQRTMRTISKANMTFGLIPKEHWSYPSWISEDLARKARYKMRNIVYGWSESYRHMCRYQSGFFFQHETMLQYDFYWRIEPDVEYTCDIDFDPFLYMQDNNKKYAFTVSLKEYAETIPTLWNATRTFMERNPRLLAENNLLSFISDDEGKSYNGCHFWSNFEIADARWLRGEAYQTFFQHLDDAGGFFYERWGDAPVHSIAAALLLPRDQIHFFREIGYYHTPFFNCPAEPELQAKCHCDPARNLNREYASCTNKFLKIAGGKKMLYPEEL